MSVQGNRALILLSGGIDSTACLAFYLSQQFQVSALFFDYGQLAAQKEDQAASVICAHYGIPLKKIACSGFNQHKGGAIAGRNAFLLQGALMAFEHDSGIIAIGVHSDTPYYDCSEHFISVMQGLYDSYRDGRVVIGAPFLLWNKRNIWDYCNRVNVPIGITYSCELGEQQPCGQCLSCKDIETLNAS